MAKSKLKLFTTAIGASTLAAMLFTSESHGEVFAGSSNGYFEALIVLQAGVSEAVTEAEVSNPNASMAAQALDAGCFEGEILWRRDSLSEICTSFCRSDADCAREGDRCRVFGLASVPTADATALADDLDPSVVGSLDNALCDPFWDLDGSLDDAQIDYLSVPASGAQLSNADGEPDPREP